MDRDRAFKWGLTEESRRWRREIVRRFPHLVDFAPAELNEDYLVKLIGWLRKRRGRFEQFGVIEDGFVVRYCFAAADDARAFYRRFAGVAERAVLRIPS